MPVSRPNAEKSRRSSITLDRFCWETACRLMVQQGFKQNFSSYVAKLIASDMLETAANTELARLGGRTCAACGTYFIPELHNDYHQHYCGAPACQRMRRKLAQRLRRDKHPKSRAQEGYKKVTTKDSLT